MDRQKTAAALLLSTSAYLLRRRRERRRSDTGRRWWVHPLNEVRDTEGAWSKVMERCRMEFPDKYQQCLRVTTQQFEDILRYIRPAITKQDTQLRKSIPPEQRLCVTLYYLATGDSIKTLSLFFRMGESTVRQIIHETCAAIWSSMAPVFLKTPSTEREWQQVAKEFDRSWQFPHCLGAIDGKHCTIQAPPNTGSEYFNYKKNFSVVLLAVSDAQYKFLYIDCGTPGRWADGGTFAHSVLHTAVEDGSLNLPTASLLPGSSKVVDHAFVADEAFPLKTWLLRPFSGRSLDTLEKKIFNFRLSRARRTIENAFGILVARWRVLRRPLVMAPENAKRVILACCVLHNYLRQELSNAYCPPGFADAVDPSGNIVEGSWRQEIDDSTLVDIAPTASRNPPANATLARDTFMNYFSEEGSLNWQTQHVNRLR